jgi:hypothetical protein
VTITFADYAGLAIILWWLLHALQGREGKVPALWVCYVPAVATALSLIPLAALDPGLVPSSAMRITRLFGAAGAAALAVHIVRNNRDSGIAILRIVAASAAIAGAYAVVQFVFGLGDMFAHAEQHLYLASGETELRGVGLVGEASSLSSQLLFAFVLIGVASPAIVPGRWKAVVVICCAMGVLVTFSRTGYILLVIAAIAMLVLRTGYGRRVGIYLALTVWAAILAIPAIRHGVAERLAGSLSASDPNALSTGRIESWGEVFAQMGDPLLIALGHGYKSIAYGQLSSAAPMFGDNTAITTLYEQGLVGLLLLVLAGIAMWRALTRDGVSGGSQSRDPVVGPLRIGLVIWLGLELAAGLTGDVLTYSRTLGPWFALYGAYLMLAAEADHEAEFRCAAYASPAREHRLMGTQLRLLLGFVIATVILVFAGTSADRAIAKPLATGVSGLDDYGSTAFDHVRRVGARFVHIPVLWEAVAPIREPRDWKPDDPADPNYRWTAADLAVVNASRAGLTPVLMIDGAPAWAERCDPPSATPHSLCDPDPEAFAAFSKAAAIRYGGSFSGLPRVRYWQGLNEPNLSLFFNPQFAGGKPVSPMLYRKLVNSFYFAVKSVQRSNVVLAAGLGPIARPLATIGPMRFTRELLCMAGRRNPRPTRGSCEGGVHFDIFDIHPYTTGGPRHRGHVDDVELGDLSKLQELLEAADKAGRIKGRSRHTPLWITEFSWDSKPPDPGGLPFPILKRWTAEALYRAWSAGVSNFFWYSLRDQSPNPGLPYSATLQAGLYFRGNAVSEDRPKPSMYAFRFPFVAYSAEDGFYFWGRTPDSRGGRVVIQVLQGGGWRNAAVTRADRHGIFEGEVEGGYGRNERGTVRARYRGEAAVPFSLKPVRDFYQPPFGKPVG